MEKYVNLFTDFGFKKVFGEEPNKDLLISFLNTLLPAKHQIAELDYSHSEWQGVTELIAFKPQEREAYQASLKYYRDLKNVIDTAYGDGLNEGIEQGMVKGIEQARAESYQERLNTARNFKRLGINPEKIAQASGLTLAEIADL